MSNEFYTARQVAERLSVQTAVVLGWIRSGGLRAVDVSNGARRKPRWRISDEALEEFIASRTAVSPLRSARRRRRRNSNVIEFF
jgi:excisionase family DNA binding protein